MANIAIDATQLVPNGRGNSRGLYALLRELAQRQTHHRFVVFINQLYPLADLPLAAHLTYVPVKPRLILLWELVQLPLMLRSYNIQLLQTISERLPLFYQGSILEYLFEIPKYRNKLQWPIASLYAKFSMFLTEILFPISVRSAKYIMTSSSATRIALIDEYQIPSDKVEVVYLGKEAKFVPDNAISTKSQTCERLGTPNGYVLHFSSLIDRRDNTEVALRAFHASMKMYPHAKLVIAGKTDPAKQGLLSLVHELGLDEAVLWIGFVPEENLADVYRSADLYLDTSLYEGFGYQVLEAMACGTPVVCSNVTSLPEVVGDAAIIASPEDIEGFAQGIVTVLSSPQRAVEMRSRGIERAGIFSWETMVDQMLKIHDQVLCE